MTKMALNSRVGLLCLFLSMQNKGCKKCWENKIKKKWFKRRKQRYKCLSCWYVFQNNSRTKQTSVIWKDFSEWKQSYKQLSSKYKISIPTVQKHLDQVFVKKKK